MPLGPMQSRGFCEGKKSRLSLLHRTQGTHSGSSSVLMSVACRVPCTVREVCRMRYDRATCSVQCAAETWCEVCGTQHSGLCVKSSVSLGLSELAASLYDRNSTQYLPRDRDH